MVDKDMLKYFYFRGKKLLLRFICIFPIKKNRIVCMSHRGASQYSDSPKYITEYLLQHYSDQFEIIWEVNDLNTFSFLNEKGIKTVKFGSMKDYYYLNTAKVCITNSGFASFLIKRNHQLRINTWHGGGAYKSGAVYGRKMSKSGTKYARKLKTYIKNQYNLMLSSCEVQSKARREGAFQYKGELLNCGLPRNDIMFRDNQEIVAKVREHFGIQTDTSILLVAPTWKSNDDNRNIQIDYEKICEILEEKTKQKWVVLLRLHHLSNIDISDIILKSKGKVINATNYPDVQELLFTANMLMSDYSSVIWDFALMGKPIILYVPDMEDYNNTRGLFMPVDKWGLAYATDEKQLFSILRELTIQEMENNSQKHLSIYNSYEKGTATETVADRIVAFCK